MFLCFLCFFVSMFLSGVVWHFPFVCLIMRHFATQKLATGISDRESKMLSKIQFSAHKLPEVSEAR